MTVLLPRRNKTVADVLSTLDGESWQDLFRQGHSEIVDLKLPRFETRSSLMLNDVMSQLGMPRAFRSEQAEFPDFCTQHSWIDLMKQDAIIKVDEEGTTAAAVTTSILVTSGLPKEVEFYVDRPFLYVVSECSTGAIFFVGQFTGKGAAAIRPSGTLGVETPTVARQADSHRVYSLTGQRLVAPPTKGIYIIGGKKRVAK
jgi:serpin B